MENENNIPKIIHYVWMGKGTKPKEIVKCMKSWKELEGFEFIEWNEENFDINSNPFVKRAYEEKKWAFVSDYVRAWAIYNYGGIYFDTDILLVNKNKFSELLKNDAFVGYENNYMPFTAVFGAKKHHPFLKKMLEHYENNETNLKTTNTFWVSEILINEYKCELKNKEQLLTGNIKVYKKEVLCVPSRESITVHAFTGSWLEEKGVFGKICTYLRLNSLNGLCRFIYSNIIIPIKEKKNERIFNNNNSNV